LAHEDIKGVDDDVLAPGTDQGQRAINEQSQSYFRDFEATSQGFVEKIPTHHVDRGDGHHQEKHGCGKVTQGPL
jgi:hypothetical protein